MKTKKFLSFALVLAMLAGMFPGMSLTASAAGNTTEITPTNTSGTMTITLTIKAAQTITTSDVTATYGDTDKSVTASVTTPSTGGGAISYSVKEGSGDYISVASDGKLTIKAVPPTDGKAYVIVTAAATDDYAETTTEVTVNISTKAMTVSASDVTATADGQPHGITVNVTDPATGYTVKYGTEAGSYTLDASPTQTEVGEKTVYYQVTADNYTTYTGSAKVTVSAKSAQTITASDVTATYGDTGKKIEASTTGDGGLSYAVKSGDAVTVDASGNLTIVKAGSAVITVTAAETDTYAQATKDVNVTVNTKAMTVSAEDVNVTVDGQAHGITVTVTDPASGATVKYGTEAGSYTLDASPTQTEVGEKTVYYQVTADNYTTYTGSAKVTVSAKSAQTITASDVTATYGDTGKKIEASTNGDGGLSYAVKSGDAVTVDASGNLTIVKAGSAVITVTAAETDTYAQATKDVNVTVNTKAMTVSAEDVNVTVDGQAHGITVTVTDPASGATVKYGTEAGSYTLDASPTQTEVGEKTVYYQVTADNYTTYTGSAKVTVSAKSAQTITASDVTATYGDTGKKIEASTTGDGGLSYAVKSGDAVTVDASGNLTIVKAGSAIITVTAAETDTYAQATKDLNVTVNTKAMTVSAEDVNVTVDGQAHGITVTVTDPASGATVKYGTEAGSYTLDASPTQTEVGEKTVYYQVTADNYTTYTGSAKVTITALPTYEVTYKVVNGTWSDDSTTDKTETVQSGSKPASVPTGMKAASGYTGGAWDTDPAGATITEATTFTYTFTAIPIYTVTVTNDGHGTGSAAPVSGAEGTEVTLNATPAEGYAFKEWQVVSGGVTVKDNKFTIGTANVEIKAVFEQAGNMEDEVIVEPGAPAVSGTNIDEVAAGVVTADEVAAGVKVWVDISPLAEAAVPAGDKALANQAMQGFGGTAGAWIDMSMFKQVTGQNKTAVHQTATAFRFSMKVPDSLKKAGRTFWLLRLHNDKADILATTTGDTLSGETNLFSTYLIAYKDAETPTPTPKPVPKTGDQDHPGLWILLMLIGIAGLTVIGTLKVSRKRK